MRCHSSPWGDFVSRYWPHVLLVRSWVENQQRCVSRPDDALLPRQLHSILHRCPLGHFCGLFCASSCFHFSSTALYFVDQDATQFGGAMLPIKFASIYGVSVFCRRVRIRLRIRISVPGHLRRAIRIDRITVARWDRSTSGVALGALEDV